jgi:hypothetical protein
MSRISIDYLKSGVNVFDQASFPPEKLDQNSLLELAHMILKDFISGFPMDKVGVEGDNERNQ